MGDRLIYDEWCSKDSLEPAGIEEFRSRWLKKIGFPEGENSFDELDEDGISREDFPISKYGQAYDDVEKDVGRSMLWFSTDQADSAKKQKSLSRVLLHTLKDGKGAWSYFQGMHDIASLLVLALGEKGARSALTYLCKFCIGLWIQKDVGCIMDNILAYVLPLLSLEDGKLYNMFKEVNATPLFCIGWILTWFTHEVEDPLAGYKLVDSLIMRDPQPQDNLDNEKIYASRYVVYLCVAVIILLRDGLLSKEKIDPNVIHHYFTTEMAPIVNDRNKLPVTANGTTRSSVIKDNVLNVDEIIQRADKLVEAHGWPDVSGTYESLKGEKDRKDEQQDICVTPTQCANKPVSTPKKVFVGLVMFCITAIGTFYYYTSNQTTTATGTAPDLNNTDNINQ